MKTLVFSDLHLHNWTYGATLDNGWNSRLYQQVKVCEQIYKSAVDNEVDQVVFCGDMFHTPGRIETHVLNAAVRAMELFRPFNFHLLVGNHDYIDKKRDIHALRWIDSDIGYVMSNRSGMKMITIYNSKPMVFLSYTDNKLHVEDALNYAPEGAVVYMHQGVSNVPMGSGFVVPNEILSEDMIPSHVKRVLVGHYHKPWDGEKISVVGSPMQHNWGDVDFIPRGWLIYDDETNNITRYESDAPKFINMVGGPLSNKEDIPEVYEVLNNYIKVSNFTGDKDKFRERLLHIGARSVEFELVVGDVVPLPASNIGFDLEKASNDYAELNGGDKDVGQSLRSGTYDISNN